MDRAGAMVGAVVAVIVVAGGIVGVEVQQGNPFVLAVPLGVVALGWALFRRSDGGVEIRWAGLGRADHPQIAHGAPPSLVPEAKPPATRRQVVAALARVEARAWLSSPWLGAGVGFCVLLTVLFGWLYAGNADDGFEGVWRDWFVLFPIMAHPLVGMAVVGAHHAVTRGRHDGAEELFGACPADETTRTAAHLCAGWVPAAVVAVFVVASTALFAANTPRVYGPIDTRALADVLAAVVLAVCGAWLGVALGRWAPSRLAPLVFVAALVPVILGLGNIGEPHWSNARQLSTWPRYPDHDLLFTDPPVWWHLLWLAALGGLMVWLGVVHANRAPRVLLAGVAVAVVATGAGIAQTRPLSSGAAGRLASLVAEPQLHQTCRGTGAVRLCVYDGYEGYLDMALVHAAPVVATVPDVVGAMTFRQGFDGEAELLGPEVARALARLPDRRGNDLPLGFSASEEAMTALRLTIGLHAVGLPVVAREGGIPLGVAGQARGVVALWLATRGLDLDVARQTASHHFNPDDRPEDPTPNALDLGMAWPDPCLAERPPPVALSAQDLAAVRALLTLPEDDVHDLLLQHWARYTDPATTTDELLAGAGLNPVGRPDVIHPVPVTCPH